MFACIPVVTGVHSNICAYLYYSTTDHNCSFADTVVDLVTITDIFVFVKCGCAQTIVNLFDFN